MQNLKDKNLTEKESRTDTLIDWTENSRSFIFLAVGALLMVIGGYFGFHYYKANQERDAQREMFQAVYYFEQDSLRVALEGDGNNLGFEQIIDEYGITDAANLARLYAGTARLKQDKFEEAIDHLKDFDSDNVLLKPRANSLIGDAYMELGKYEDAANYYEKAASDNPNPLFTPAYLLKEALAYEKLKRFDKASTAYDQIIKKYRNSFVFSNAQKLKSRLGVQNTSK